MNIIDHIINSLDLLEDDKNKIEVKEEGSDIIIETSDIDIATGILEEAAEKIYNYYCADEGEFTMNFNIKPERIQFRLKL